MTKKKIETSKQIEAFEFYYRMDRRNFAEAGKHVGVSDQTVGTWARQFDWQQRLEDRAEKERQEKEKAYLSEVRNRTDLQKKAYQLVQGKAIEHIGKERKPGDPELFTNGNDAVRALDIGIKGEREVMGLRAPEGQAIPAGSTTNIQNNVTIALSEMAQNGQREVILRALKRIYKELNPGPAKKTD